jgi:hypothetical protein
MGGTGLGLCPLMGFSISDVKYLGSIAREMIDELGSWYKVIK